MIVMRFVALLVPVFVILQNFYISAEEIEPPTPILHRVRRIVGGSLSNARSVPYMVNIRKRNIFVCGGALLTPRCVVTAAHCVKDASAQEIVVRGGITYLDDKHNSRRVKFIYLPTIYNSTSLDNDIAMLQLQYALNGPNINSIKMAGTSPQPGTFVQVTGWGLTKAESLKPSNQLRSVYVTVMDRGICQRMYQGYRNITDAMFCASVPGLKDACAADSGGPAVANGRLVGIVSWGKGNRCADAQAPGVYVNIVHERHWIKRVLRDYF